MRIDQLTVRNFKKFSQLTLDLHPQLTVLVGDNGSGKTSILDALAVSLGIWLVDPPDPSLRTSGRNILPTEIRLKYSREGDRTQFRAIRPVIVEATGQIGDAPGVTWIRQIREAGKRTTNLDAKKALRIIKENLSARRSRRTSSVSCAGLLWRRARVAALQPAHASRGQIERPGLAVVSFL